MIGGCILLLSLGALLEFFVSYCRTQLASSARVRLTEHVLGIAGTKEGHIAAGEFGALVRLSCLCPGTSSRGNDVAAVRVYYRLLNFAGVAPRSIFPALRAWVDGERTKCAHFAGVILDRQIAYSRRMIAEQLSASL
ncbi:MAG TPA: hypothetical protein VN862_04855 [Candidatus Acidoferrales bacterium]|nr:hypothetical protein [Candidatus Acidoferrales bacterium]